jgi:hypothetical protein
MLSWTIRMRAILLGRMQVLTTGYLSEHKPKGKLYVIWMYQQVRQWNSEAIVPAVVILPSVDHDRMSPGAWMPSPYHSFPAQRRTHILFMLWFLNNPLLMVSTDLYSWCLYPLLSLSLVYSVVIFPLSGACYHSLSDVLLRSWTQGFCISVLLNLLICMCTLAIGVRTWSCVTLVYTEKMKPKGVSLHKSKTRENDRHMLKR